MEKNNSFKTLLYVFLGLAVVVVAVVYFTKHGKKGDANFVIGKAPVSEVSVTKDKDFPIGIVVKAEGNFKDNCTIVGDATQSMSGNTFMISLESKRSTNPKDCVDTSTSFEKDIILENVIGLKKGEYFVDVNGVKGTFALYMDNFISADDPLK
jgi:inhibitor of cysteine peptidase